MMFRSLLFAPLLATADVQEQSVLLQMKGRAETQVLLQRASEGISSETLRSLEMGVMAKGRKKVETAKCAYHMKTLKEEYDNKMTPCQVLDTLEELYEDTFDDWEDISKQAEKAVKEVIKVAEVALKNYPNGTLPETFEFSNATMLNLPETKFYKNFVKATDKKFGSEMNATEIYDSILSNGILEAAESAFDHINELQEDAMSLLRGQVLINDLPENSTFNVTLMHADALQNTGKGRVNARKSLEAYAFAKQSLFVNAVGQAFAEFWVSALEYSPEDDAADPFVGLDWTDKRDVKKAGDKFYLLASGFADEANVEDTCKSEAFNLKKPMLKQVCKGSSKPKCLDELMYLNEDTEGICEVANSKAIRKVRSKKFTDQKFIDYCNSTTEDADAEETPLADCEMYFVETQQPWQFCSKVNDVRKACKQIHRYNKAEAKKALKLKKKAFNAEKKACYKACRSKPRKDRRACKKECKTAWHKSKLDNFTIPVAEVVAAAE